MKAPRCKYAIDRAAAIRAALYSDEDPRARPMWAALDERLLSVWPDPDKHPEDECPSR